MVRYINPNDIIKSEQFVREPVDDLNRDIALNPSKIIILNGGRGSGKSIALHNMENKGLGTENQTIFMRFDSIISFSKNPNEVFDKQFFNHYFELIFSWKLLSYIERNYTLTYNLNFKDIETLIKEISKNTDCFIDNVYYEKIELQRYLTSTEISNEIIERFKKIFNIETLTLAIDRFDWINGSSDYTQQIIQKYFNLFDKTIITADDLALDNEERRVELKKKGYSLVDTTYGRNIEVIKQIIRKRIELLNKNADISQRKFDVNIITDKIYKNLVNKFNGNISLILNTVNEVAELYDCYGENIGNLEEQFKDEADNQLEKLKQLRKINAHPPKLHL